MGDDSRQCLSLCWLSPDLQPVLSLTGCTFTVLVHTREAATRNMEKIQVIKVSGIFGCLFTSKLQRMELKNFGFSEVKGC